MAAYAVPAGQIGAYEKTMVAATVDTCTFTGSDLDTVEVVSHDGAAAVYFTVDGSTPTVAGGNCWMLPAASSAVTVPVPTAGATVVKLISAGTPTVSVAQSGAAR